MLMSTKCPNLKRATKLNNNTNLTNPHENIVFKCATTELSLFEQKIILEAPNYLISILKNSFYMYFMVVCTQPKEASGIRFLCSWGYPWL